MIAQTKYDTLLKMNKKNCIIIFIKYPELGKVKSRLAPAVDEEIILDIYKSFVFDLIETLKEGSFSFKIAFYPPEAKTKFQSWLSNEFIYQAQEGNDLGEKMKNAFLASFAQDFENVLLIGSDSPDLNYDIFTSSFKSLEDHDAVIGPTFDGGYYLIGFSKKSFLAEIFMGIEWSTETVFQKTMEIFKKHNYKISILQKWHDIDTYQDLIVLYQRNQDTRFFKSETMAFLKKLF
jgi:rSAM/selenodomain-associated transferase 1